VRETVLDSGVFIASVFPETLTAQAKQLLQRLEREHVTLHAPTLLRYEMIAVTRKSVFHKRITAEEGEVIRDALLRYPVALHFDDNLLRRGYALATQFNLATAYEAQYLALAEQLACEFWTTDERLFNSVSRTLTHVRWLGNNSLAPDSASS
jgi:predicted nucleic acid-binding protein